ncbi:MAG: DNA methyltransferase [Chloroflexota bacterium]|nr:DNA methyltransferase [Chloroflexota bacterium]
MVRQVRKSSRQLKANLAAPCERPPLDALVDPIVWVTDGLYTGKTLKLFEDVSQLYELLLARLEFHTWKDDLETFRRRTAYFAQVQGQRSYHWYIAGVRGKGQIGYSSQYMTHWFYPYKGKFHGQMIKALINFMGVKGDGLVLDPFVGSGTTLVECALLGIPSVGVEINPALCIVSQIKTDCLFMDYPELESFLQSVDPLEIFKYFHQKPATALRWMLQANGMPWTGKTLLEIAWADHMPRGFVANLPFEWRNFFLLCYLHALSDHTYLQGTAKARTIEEFFIQDLQEYTATLKGTWMILRALKLTPQRPSVFLGDALHLHLPDGSVDGIVTSPPYSIALDYIKNDEHLLTYLGIDTSSLRERMIGLRGTKAEKLRLYEDDMRICLREMHRVLKPGGYTAIVLGDVVVNSTRTNFCNKILTWAPSLGFSEAVALQRPILGGYARLRYEYIILLRK